MADDAPSAWVLEAEATRSLRRALQAARAFEPARAVPVGPNAICVELPDAAPAPPRRLERRLGHPVEVRLDCAVAHYPLGRGYVVLVVSRTDFADPIDPVLDAHGIAYREIARPSELAEPARVCVPRPAIASLDQLAADLAASGAPVSAIYEVGACSR